MDEIAVGIDDGDVQLPAMLGRFGLDRGDQLLRGFQAEALGSYSTAGVSSSGV